jgi:hypothetical protein
MKIIRLITGFVLLLSFSYAKGQDRIITTQNDTVFCRILYVSATRIAYVLNKQTGENGKIEGKFIPREQMKEYYQGASSSEPSHSTQNAGQSMVNEKQTTHSPQDPTALDYENPKYYLGAGFGFDYGGFGLKFEYLPIRHLGVFAGGGYNLLSLGWNIGGTYKILPDKKISPNLMIMYGYNAVFHGSDAYSKQYEMTSYGVTAGANADIKIGKKDKISVSLFIPVRSGKFRENYKKAENDPNMNLSSALVPVGFSIGFNFGL